MNKLFIPLATVAVIAIGIGIFFVFQKPALPDSQSVPQIEKNNSREVPTTTQPSVSVGALKTLAEQRGIRFGACYHCESGRGDDIYDQIFETEMNVMTAGTFWTDGSYASRTEFNFSEMDVKVNWGRSRGMDVHGHILVWYNDIPDWLKATPKADVEAIMNEHIDTVVGRYAGKIKLWDVVNEAVNDDDGTTTAHSVRATSGPKLWGTTTSARPLFERMQPTRPPCCVTTSTILRAVRPSSRASRLYSSI